MAGQRARAFSLIEMVGVMAIIAILAAAVVPVVMKQMDQAALTKETSDLSCMAAALQSYILTTKTVPSYTDWAAAISSVAAMSVPSVTNTPRGHARAFLVDPALQIGGAGLPYTQTANSCTTAPVSARLMIVSTLARALPVSSGVPTSIAFNDIWNTPKGTKPSTWTTWAGNGQDLVIQRINLASLFCRLILNNSDVGGAGFFAVDGTNTVAMPVGAGGWSAYYLRGTTLGLCDTNGLLMARELLTSDVSHVFDSGIWRDTSQFGLRTNAVPASDPSAIAAQFINAPPPPGSKWGATPSGVASLISAYTYAYTAWATESPCFSYNGNGNANKCPEYVLINDALSGFSKGGNLVP